MRTATFLLFFAADCIPQDQPPRCDLVMTAPAALDIHTPAVDSGCVVSDFAGQLIDVQIFPHAPLSQHPPFGITVQYPASGEHMVPLGERGGLLWHGCTSRTGEVTWEKLPPEWQISFEATCNGETIAGTVGASFL